MLTAVDDARAELEDGVTPYRLFRAGAARERFDAVVRVRDGLAAPPLELVAAYSVKTNPRPELLELARTHGFLAETISPDELRCALRAGFAAGDIVCNGPLPAERSDAGQAGLHFADSVEALERAIDAPVARITGVRLRPSMLASRFGVPLEDDAAVVDALRRTAPERPFAASFHARREDFHGASWRDVAGDVLERAAALERQAGRPIVAFDVGGGWTPEEFDAEFEADMRWLARRIARTLPACRRLIFEPGQAVCTPAEALVTQVVEVRTRAARREAIVDAGYPDWPQMHSYVHGLFIRRDGRWQPLGRGPDRLGGRTCLEYDLIDGLRFPPDLAAGDRLLITGTGSYDHSMAFLFARGA